MVKIIKLASKSTAGASFHLNHVELNQIHAVDAGDSHWIMEWHEHELGSILDCPKFFSIINRLVSVINGLEKGGIDGFTVENELEDLKTKYRCYKLQYLQSQIIIDCLKQGAGSFTASTGNIMAMREVCNSDIDLFKMDCNDSDEVLQRDVDRVLDGVNAKLIKVAKLLFGRDDIITLKDLVKVLTDAKGETSQLEDKVRSLAIQNAITLGALSTDLNLAVGAVEEITNRQGPLLASYVGSLITYFDVIVESLDLKLQLIESDTRTTMSKNDPQLHDPKLLDLVRDKVTDVHREIESQQSNLLLFEQMGQPFTDLARQYQQILMQIKLAEDDINSLASL